MAASRYLTTDEVAARFRTAPSTVRYWRMIGKGPRSFRPGTKVLYDVEVVEAWEHAQQQEQYAEHARRTAGAA